MARPSTKPGPQRIELRPTQFEGVFRNSTGALVDERGVRVSIADIREKEAQRWRESVDTVPQTPAELLRAAAMDPMLPMDTRLRAAKDAAPYYDQRMPIQVEGEIEGKGTLDLARLAEMSREDRETLLRLLKAAGAVLA